MIVRAVRAGVAAVVAGASLVPAALAGYLGFLTVVAWGSSRRVRPPAPGPAGVTRFAFLVPAHDEERLIAATVASLVGQDYPPDAFFVHVVADNCNDDTVALARAAGAEVHERVAPGEGGKGRALGWALQRLWDRGDPHEAVVVVDADTLVDRGFLAAVDEELRRGALVVQAFYGVRDEEATPATAFRAAALAARHHTRPLGRTALGGTAGLFGNGMAFRREVLQRRGFSSHLTEDVEMALELLLEGTTVAYAPRAAVRAEMPTTLEASATQHERWERGRLDLARRFVPPLARQAITGGPAGRLAAADATLDQLVPPLSVLAAASVAAGAGGLGWAALRPGRASATAALAGAGATLALTGHVIGSLCLTDAPPSTYRALVGAPRAVVWKVRLWLRMLLRPGQVTWVRTARNPTA